MEEVQYPSAREREKKMIGYFWRTNASFVTLYCQLTDVVLDWYVDGRDAVNLQSINLVHENWERVNALLDDDCQVKSKKLVVPKRNEFDHRARRWNVRIFTSFDRRIPRWTNR